MIVVVGGCEVVFDSAAQAFLPMIVDSQQLARANGLLFAAEVIAGSIVGLAIGAFFFDWSPGLPFSVNAATFAAAAILILTIVSAKKPMLHEAAPFDRRLRIGFTWLRSNPLLTTLAWMFCFTNFGLMLGQGIFVKFAVEELGLSNNEFGLLLAITAMGAATGGLSGYRVVNRIGLRGAVAAPYLIFGSAQVVIGIAPSAWAVAAAGFILGAAITVWNIATVTVRQQVIPGERFGRVNAVYRWLGAIASGAGVATGGFIAFATNLRAPFLVGGVVTLGAAVFFAQPVLAGLKAATADAPNSSSR
jgi:MFS family permease